VGSILASHVASRAVRAAGQQCCVVGHTLWSPPTLPLVQHCQRRRSWWWYGISRPNTWQQRSQSAAGQVWSSTSGSSGSWCHTSAAAAVAICNLQPGLVSAASVCSKLHVCDCAACGLMHVVSAALVQRWHAHCIVGHAGVRVFVSATSARPVLAAHSGVSRHRECEQWPECYACEQWHVCYEGLARMACISAAVAQQHGQFPLRSWSIFAQG